MIGSFTKSLNAKLMTLFIVISVVSIITTGALSLKAAEDALRERIDAQLQNEAKYRANLIENLWSLRVEQVQLLASNQQVKNILKESNKQIGQEFINTQDLEKTIPPSTEDSNFYDLKIVDKDGKIISATNSSLVGKDLSKNPNFLRGVREASYSIERDDKTGKAVMVVTAPVFDDAEHSQEIGVIQATRGVDLANKITTDRANLGKTGETYLVNRDRLMITESRFIQNAIFTQKVDTLPVKECFENGHNLSGIYSTYLKTAGNLGQYTMGKAGVVYTDYRGIPVFGASYCDKDLGFVLLAEMDVSELYSPLLELQNQYLIIGSFISLGVGILSFFVVRTISRPIMNLTHTVEKISQGDFTVDVKESTSKDEIGRLHHSFRIMISNLLQSIEQIQNLNSELKIVNEKLRLKDKLKDEFISIASHELKNPVQPILGFAYLAKKGKIPHDEAWDGVLQHARRLKRLAIDILDVSKIESGTLDYRFAKVHLNQVIHNVTESLRVNLSPGVNMEVDLDQKDPEIYADVERITQVLENIIENAIKFTKHGLIKIESYNHHDKVDIVISDTGGGISRDILPNLFDKFVTQSVKDGMEHGTGLGLFIAKEIITAHKGKIAAHNNKIGGATFTVTLPIDSDDAGRKS